MVGQFRPKKLISDIKREFSAAEDLELSVFKSAAKHVLDKSLYSVGLCSQLSIGPSTSLLWSTEGHGHKKGKRSKFMLYHKASICLLFYSFLSIVILYYFFKAIHPCCISIMTYGFGVSLDISSFYPVMQFLSSNLSNICRH